MKRYTVAPSTLIEVEEGYIVLHSDYADLLARHNALVDAVAWLRECSEFHEDKAVFYLDTWWEHEVFNSLEAARAEVDRILSEEK